jgi:glycosyltransferase involved in cell wall biosynthesis
MKIVEVCGYYPPHIGGIEYVAEQVAQEFVRAGHEVTVLTSSLGGQAGTTAKKGVRIVRMRAFDFAHTPFMLALPFRLLSLHRENVIHLHLSHVSVEMTVFLIAKLRRLPYVAHYHMDVEPSGSFGWLYRAYKRLLLPKVVRRARRVIALSEEQRDVLVTRYKVPPHHVIIIPNGVGEEYFIVGDRRLHTPRRLLYVGRFAKQKNLGRLLRSIPLLKLPTEVHLVGDGEEAGQLQLLVKELGLQNVRFEGAQDAAGVRAAYLAADVFVMTSDREGMPLALLEAAAAGLPVVASRVQGLREFVRDNGMLAEPSPEAFAAALNKLLPDKKEMARLSRASREWASRHTWPLIAAQIGKVLEDAR